MEPLLVIQRDVGKMESDIKTMQEDIREVRGDIAQVRKDVQEIKNTIQESTVTFKTTYRIILGLGVAIGALSAFAIKILALVIK